GAQIIAHPANLVLPGVAQLTMRARALENRVFTVTANRIGEERRGGESLRFTGQSQIVSPRGEVLASSPEGAEEAVAVEIDPAIALDKRLTPLNDLLADRRVDLYEL
ncbi:acyltransferase, partial [Candidatus Acetothermia bacterium]